MKERERVFPLFFVLNPPEKSYHSCLAAPIRLQFENHPGRLDNAGLIMSK